MDFVPQLESNILVIVILVIILIIVFVLHIMKSKTQKGTSECNCSNLSKQLILPQNNKILSAPTAPTRFDTAKPQTKGTLSLYYADWCGWSKRFLPEWEKIKSKVQSSDLKNKIECKEYNCPNEKDICEKNGVRGYPSIILHKTDGTATSFPDDKPRTAEAILEFVQKQI